MERVSSLGVKSFERLAFWVSAVVAFILYVSTLGSGFDFGVGHGRLVAASSWGIAAPPGYPLWTLLANGVVALFGWVSWDGLANPAWAVSLLSSVCGAGSVGLLARLMTAVFIDMIQGQKSEPLPWMGPLVTFVSCVSAFLFAISPRMWACAVRADVETWEMLLFCLILFWSYCFLKHPTAKVLGVLSFFFGVALTNGLSFLWLGIPLWAMVFVAHRPLAKALLALFIPLALTAHLLSIGALPSAYEGHLMVGEEAVVRPIAQAMHGMLPLGFLPAGYYVGFFVLLLSGVCALIFCPRAHEATRALRKMVHHWWAGVLVAGVLFLALLVMAIGRSTYVVAPLFEGTLFSFGYVWVMHLLALAVVWGICARFHRSRRYALAVTFVQVGSLLLYQHGFMVGVTHPRLWWFWWPIVWVALLLFLGWRWLLCGRGAVRCILLLLAALAFYLYVPLVSLMNLSPEQWGEPFSWMGFHRLIEEGLGLGLPTKALWGALGEMVWALCFSEGLGLLFWGVAGFVVMGVYGAGRYRVRWLLFLMAWLVCCCLVFLLLAERGPMHEWLFQLRLEVILVLGLGGLVTMSAWRMFERMEASRLTIAMILGALFLVVFAGGSLLYIYVGHATLPLEGGPEMRGHTMAWTWGRGLLEGAPYFHATLSPDQEPLPDPFWPPKLDETALVLSSTQVPYALTVASGVRRDVKVLKGTLWSRELYMAVCRRREGHATLNLPDRRQIEALAHRLHFKSEAPVVSALASQPQQLDALVLDTFVKASKHPIYIDGEVPYPALYRYLEPSGIGLKIARLWPKTENVGIRDVDFWDWFSRMLWAQPNFEREALGRKTFAQQQLVLAELYRRQGWIDYAYRSLVTAFSAYPIEATVPYVEIFLLRSLALEGPRMDLSRMENALQMLRLAVISEPEDLSLKALIATLEEQKSALECCKRLQVSLNKGTISINERCLYIDACLRLGAREDARAVAAAFVTKFIPPGRFMTVLETVLALEDSELLYAVAVKMPPEQYESLTERALLEMVKVALMYHHRPLAKALLAEGEARLEPSACLYWRKACYYHLYEDDALASQFLEEAKALSEGFFETLPEAEARLLQAIEDRAMRLKEKGTRP